MQPESTHVAWHSSKVCKQSRQLSNGHGSCVLWFTGLSGSGKSTLAAELELALHELHCRSYMLDGDNLRLGLNRGLGFSQTDRSENIRRMGETARLFVDAGFIALAAAITPYQADRELLRSRFEPEEFIEVYVRCAIEECERRDPKGLYRKARAGEIRQFTGLSAPYEAPEHPEIEINSEKVSVAESVSILLRYLRSKGYLPADRKGGS
ncbi:adenylyl-sulfate kinase [Paenibacillus radicis (ex Gao et al. 2016)]|uniref:Adenylyl-sulfate kinase n=1 Tax=Paenibacillus radicis (ex Gao et al. 2016) TaxID=1737354 RepID=A0A917H190_9BACL|nr:adenylyl-sulfate kinase [Paenibacillus radicis (ex Gao et al. 2016)]GGG64185.1 adenylyl-sulfate kinase [Paenibacillus radicis (ex Gao et al. 2016)]